MSISILNKNSIEILFLVFQLNIDILTKGELFMLLNDFVKKKLEANDVIFHSHFRKQQSERKLNHLKSNVLIPAILNGQVIEFN